MSDCKKYREMISSYADGELSGNEKTELQKHLDGCASCRSLLSFYTNVSAAAAESLVEPPAGFTESVMSKIKALPADDQSNITHIKTKKHDKSLKPVIISFVAAAACLALAFIVSPELFGITRTGNATSAPMASSAPAPIEAYEVAEAPADSGEPNAQAKIAQDAASGSAEMGAADANTAPAAPAATAGSVDNSGGESLATAAPESPTPEPGLMPQFTTVGKAEEDELKVYFAVFEIKGQLPDGINEISRIDNGDGTFSIVISTGTASQLIEGGYEVTFGAPESATALIKFTPPS